MEKQGKIITFYSYKGGVGRSMALANVGWLLATKYGRNVLVVDWDLEAPGLHRFFGIGENEIDTGLIDLFEKYKTRLKEEKGSLPTTLVDIKSSLIKVPLKEALNGGSLSLLGAGKQGSGYAKRVNEFDWNDFYETWHGYGFFEFLKTELKQTAEIVLLDSRTGVTDIGSICTLQLPDVVVLLFALNEQNISGTEFIAKSIIENAPKLSEKAKTPVIMIRPARVEKYLEQDKKNEWEEKASKRLRKYLPPENQDNALKFLKQNSIPYIGAYSFGETPLATESVDRQADEPAVSFDALAVSILKVCGLWTDDERRSIAGSIEYASARLIQVSLGYLLGIMALFAFLLVKLWPSIDTLGGWVKSGSIFGIHFSLNPTPRLFLISLVAAGLGACLTVMRELTWQLGNKSLRRPFLRQLYLQPLIGMVSGFFVALLTMNLIRDASQVSVFSVAAIAAIVGIFYEQVWRKLVDIFKVILTNDQR
ncbi:MAG TPA: hypothetical protein VN844_17950 [Pyrinomonadaceae bacterium]|nr:hypothetical protein [Pyrinomonadaceae bacterium]